MEVEVGLTLNKKNTGELVKLLFINEIVEERIRLGYQPFPATVNLPFPTSFIFYTKPFSGGDYYILCPSLSFHIFLPFFLLLIYTFSLIRNISTYSVFLLVSTTITIIIFKNFKIIKEEYSIRCEGNGKCHII